MNYSENTPDECLNESVKLTMIDQGIAFEKQVNELQQLYAIQKSLMKGEDKFTRWDFHPMKRTFTESHMLGSTRFVLDDPFSQEHQDFFSRIPLDLRLSTGSFCNDDDLDNEELNLSLSIGIGSNKRSRINGKSSKNKIMHPPAQHIIDLEESIETRSNEDANQVFSLDRSRHNYSDHLIRYPSHGMTESSMSSGYLQQELQRTTESLLSRCNMDQVHLKIHPSHRKTKSLMNDGVHQEWSSFNQGSNEWDRVKSTISLDLDLNKEQPDESSFQSNEPLGPTGSSTCGQIGKPIKPGGTIDLESMPEPSSDLTLENKISKEEQKAALSLISISLQQASNNYQDSETKSGLNKIEADSQNDKKTIPRASSMDSYESLVLKLEESSIDEDSVTSRAFEINEVDKKENGIKLRRGRRLKDFQKDVLPTIASLSRHEIWEDISILEGVIRSREYKRMHKAKMGNGEKWLTPVRSKLLRVNYVSQKKRSKLKPK